MSAQQLSWRSPEPASLASTAPQSRQALLHEPGCHGRFIDYEYAGFNPVAYDFANHWCEYAADYHTAHPHVMDYGMLPDVHMQRVFLRAYVNAVLALQQHMAQQACPLGFRVQGSSFSV